MFHYPLLIESKKWKQLLFEKKTPESFPLMRLINGSYNPLQMGINTLPWWDVCTVSLILGAYVGWVFILLVGCRATAEWSSMVGFIAQNGYCSRDIYLQFNKALRSVILRAVMLRRLWKRFSHWLPRMHDNACSLIWCWWKPKQWMQHDIIVLSF